MSSGGAVPPSLQTPPDPRKVFDHAIRFTLTELHLRQTAQGNEKTLMIPGMVLSAFASELFIKCICLIDGRTPPKSHNLSELFDAISEDYKIIIENLWNEAVKKNAASFDNAEALSKREIPRDLRSALIECGNAFEAARYFHENPNNLNFYILDLPCVLWTAILNIKPEWQ